MPWLASSSVRRPDKPIHIDPPITHYGNHPDSIWRSSICFPRNFEKLLQRSSRGSLEEASEDEDKADEEGELYQTPFSEPPNEEIQNHNGSVIQQTVFPENGIGPITPPPVRQSSCDATNTSTAVKNTRAEQVNRQSAIPNDRPSTPGELANTSLTRLSPIEGMTRGPDTSSAANFPYVNSFTEEHHCVETATDGARPLAKQARGPSRRSRQKRYAKLKEEMKRLSHASSRYKRNWTVWPQEVRWK
ncbi:hypothetical protein AYO20_00532 [Fonsecaea nubica]|uniref:Uncharacterized protein n=1 Tax=Fonsecaea nubica TaxID=856822 RepID=A0A178DFK1_9EURO|nr:hypothetical protein AYO20_00532 [Fonsecaea nubica]OAL40114.1 hypothetical protein AYO20_00532 [Fonsecaea nubica]